MRCTLLWQTGRYGRLLGLEAYRFPADALKISCFLKGLGVALAPAIPPRGEMSRSAIRSFRASHITTPACAAQ